MTAVTMAPGGRHIWITASPEARRHIRKIPGARWSEAGGRWTIRPSKVAWGMIAAIPGAQLDTAADWHRAETMAGAPSLRPWPQWYAPKTVPYAHQMAGSAQMYGRRESAVFAEPGTGKTKMAIDAISARYGAGEVDRLLVLCPKSVRAVWVREFATHCPVPHDVQLLKTPSTLPEFGRGLRVLVVSAEGMSTKNTFNTAAKFAMSGRCALVIDEAHMFKTHNTQRTKSAVTIAAACVSVTVMTGTPVGNSLVDLYAQFNILSPDIIGYPDYWSFCDRYCVFGGYENRSIVGYDNEDELMGNIRPYTFRATKAECLDLPPKVYERRTVVMLPEQKAKYKELSKHLRLEGLETKTALDLMMRLHQIAGGFIPSAAEGERSVYAPISNGKLEELIHIAQDSAGQSVVIWCSYQHEVAHVVAGLGREFGRGSVVEIHGGVKESDRAAAIAAIQSGAARFLVGIAASGGAGITATAASLMVYYSNNFSYIQRAQSEDRCYRLGQTRTVTIIDLVAEGTVDETIMDALAAKVDLARWVADHGATNSTTGMKS